MSKARGLANLGNAYSDGALSNRNLIINGAMQVAQRGTSHTLTGANAGYNTVDRFQTNIVRFDQCIMSETQSTDAPNGFGHSFKVQTTTVEDAIASDEYSYMRYRIEAQDLIRAGFGTSASQPLTLSFWIKSSLTGTFGVSFYRPDANRLYSSSYNINSANTWEYKTITIPADTTGAVSNDNGSGMELWFPWTLGSDYQGGSSTVWATYSDANFAPEHSQNGLLTTLNATWQITGVQLEVGDTATPFEHRSYGEELALCQRYYERWTLDGGFVGTAGYNETTSNARGMFPFTVTKRTAPTMATSGAHFHATSTGTTGSGVNISWLFTNIHSSRWSVTNSNSTLVDGGASVLGVSGNGRWIEADAEL